MNEEVQVMHEHEQGRVGKIMDRVRHGAAEHLNNRWPEIALVAAELTISFNQLANHISSDLNDGYAMSMGVPIVIWGVVRSAIDYGQKARGVDAKERVFADGWNKVFKVAAIGAILVVVTIGFKPDGGWGHKIVTEEPHVSSLIEKIRGDAQDRLENIPETLKDHGPNAAILVGLLGTAGAAAHYEEKARKRMRPGRAMQRVAGAFEGQIARAVQATGEGMHTTVTAVKDKALLANDRLTAARKWLGRIRNIRIGIKIQSPIILDMHPSDEHYSGPDDTAQEGTDPKANLF